jgi:hypothetical protein
MLVVFEDFPGSILPTWMCLDVLSDLAKYAIVRGFPEYS